MSWWSSVALPAISRTVDPTGTLAKAVDRATSGATGGNRAEVARAFLDPLNVTKYVAKKSTTQAPSSSSNNTGKLPLGELGGELTTQVTSIVQSYWPFLLGGLLLLLILRRR